jgi:hypothetical protein
MPIVGAKFLNANSKTLAGAAAVAQTLLRIRDLWTGGKRRMQLAKHLGLALSFEENLVLSRVAGTHVDEERWSCLLELVTRHVRFCLGTGADHAVYQVSCGHVRYAGMAGVWEKGE